MRPAVNAMYYYINYKKFTENLADENSSVFRGATLWYATYICITQKKEDFGYEK